MKDREIKIIAISGSLRQDSYNKKALLAAKELLPKNTVLEIVDINNIPLFNEDVEKEGIPKEVIDFKNKLADADAILISSPEYNYSIPGVLKNALDWASRGNDMPLSGKPLAIISASIGNLGGPRVQYHLRQVCAGLNMLIVNRPEVYIVNASESFDPKGNLNDERAKKLIEKLMLKLVELARLINKSID